MRDWFRTVVSSGRRHSGEDAPLHPDGELCLNCGTNLKSSSEYARYRVCPECRYHYYLPAKQRIDVLADPSSFREANRFLVAQDEIEQSSRSRYRGQLREAQRRTGLFSSAIMGECHIVGREVVLVVIDFAFLGGTIGSIVAEKVARAFELAGRRKLPLITVISSTGPRLQEGPLVLTQAAKLLAAARRFSAERVPHICIMTNPTTGGIYSGFANIADVIIAEPGALLGFAPRGALAHATGASLPQTVDTAEEYLGRGLVDQLADRAQQRELLSVLIELLGWRYRLTLTGRLRRQLYEAPQASGWQNLELARNEMRPTAKDYITHMTSSFVEIRGDRLYGDDPAVICGLADISGEAIMVVGQQRMPQNEGIMPEGFHKARRAMLLAAKFRLPLLTIVDSTGVHLGLEAEQRGVGYALSQCVATMSDLPTPVIAAVVGEADGDASLAFGMADRTLMMENAVYCALPSGDGSQPTADTGNSPLTAKESIQAGLVDEIVAEPTGGAHADHEEAARLLREAVLAQLTQLQSTPVRRLVNNRYRKYRSFGRYSNLRSALYHPVRKARGRLSEEARGLLGRWFPGIRQRPPDDSEDVPIP